MISESTYVLEGLITKDSNKSAEMTKEQAQEFTELFFQMLEANGYSYSGIAGIVFSKEH